ncbi:MAG: ABC transporter substrate-binding protein [Cyclobacteriaceae bacterium]|nr:ABC transporter substrate-binding protein [Cyclobacteriaceae bacterium]
MKIISISCTSALCFILLFSGCGGKQERSIDQLLEVKGERYAGGVFRLNESEYIKNLFPHNITDAYSYRVAQQIYEGLFKFDVENLDVVNNLCESWEVDENLTRYTFTLKKGVMFHDDPCFENGKGREMTAADVAYCFTRLCTKSQNNQNFATLTEIIKGASKYYEASKSGLSPVFEIEGIKVIDKYRIELSLNEPNALLIVHLARPGCYIYPKEAEEAYGLDMRIHTVGTGPFYLSNVDEDISLILKRNENYHQADQYGNPLPYLNALSITFIKDKKSELFEFRKGNLDMIYRLPTEFIIEILEESISGARGEYSQFDLQRSPEMMTQFISLNHQGKIFSDINVRKAFSFAIDRSKILDFVLNGEGYGPGVHGITPPGYNKYDIEDIAGYSLNIDSAKYFLQLAGYPGGKDFPKLQYFFNTEGERQTHVAVELQKQLKDHLNIDIELISMPFAQLLEKSFKGDYDILRAAWVADFPSPENFLWLFYSKDVAKNPDEASYPNIARYINKNFDRLYDAALKAPSLDEANRLFKLAEQNLMKDAPVIVLWYEEGYRLVQNYVRNFPNNPMQYRDFSNVWFEPKSDGS